MVPSHLDERPGRSRCQTGKYETPLALPLAGAKLLGSEASDLKLRTILRQNQTDVEAESWLPVAAVCTNSFLILYPPVSYSVPGFFRDLSGPFQDNFHPHDQFSALPQLRSR